MKKIVRWLDAHFEETLLIILLLAITILTGAQVVMRRLMNSPLSWSEEICRYCFMWSGFLGVAYCIRRRCDIRINTFTGFFSERAQKCLMLATSLVSIVVLGKFFQVSVGIVGKTLSSAQTSPAVGIPFYIIYFCTVLGFGLALIRLVQAIYIDLRDLVHPRSPAENTLTGGDA